MNKPELIARVAARHGLSRHEAAQICELFLAEITQSLAGGEEVLLSGFGKFTAVARAERVVRHPRSGQATIVPAGYRVRFTTGSRLREALDVRVSPTHISAQPRSARLDC